LISEQKSVRISKILSGAQQKSDITIGIESWRNWFNWICKGFKILSIKKKELSSRVQFFDTHQQQQSLPRKLKTSFSTLGYYD
jgi:hypothetical protein